MNVKWGSVPKSEPNFGWVSIILQLTAKFVLPMFAKKGTSDIVSVTFLFLQETCDIT